MPKPPCEDLARFTADVMRACSVDISTDGWSVRVFTRRSGANAGTTYRQFYPPCGGGALRSMKEVVTYLASTGHAARGAKRKGAGPGAARQARGKVGKGDDELDKAMSAPTPTEVPAPVVIRESASAVVTGIVADEDMDEDRLSMEFMSITGFEPDYKDVIELRKMLEKERARAAATKESAKSSSFTFDRTAAARGGGSRRGMLEELPNGTAASLGEERKAAQHALVAATKRAAMASADDMAALGDVSRADWRGVGRVPRFLGNTSVPDVVRGGTRAGAAPKISGTDAEIRLLPASTSMGDDVADDVDTRPPFDPRDSKAVATLKAALHTSAAPAEVRCREAERGRVIDLIQGCLRDHKPGSLYLAGLPGTGKTLTLKEVEATSRKWGISGKSRPQLAFINCMALYDQKAIFGAIIEQLGESVLAEDREVRDDVVEFSDVPEVSALRRIVTTATTASKSGMCIILLDEMDQLVTKAQDILYELFALPALKNSRCILAGVSNAMNLTDRVLPRLRARGCEPALVPFAAYVGKQLKVLLKQRLAVLPFTAFEDSALELCSRKVGAATGDMRKALNVCATAIDICVQEANASSSDLADTDPNAVPMKPASIVKISHMARALSKTYASPVVDSIRALPQMQQMVLCSAVRLVKQNAKSMETTLGALHDSYTALCRETGVKELPQGEFCNMCTALADHCLVKLGNANNDRLRKLRLLATEDDVVFSLQGVHFFRNLLGSSK